MLLINWKINRKRKTKLKSKSKIKTTLKPKPKPKLKIKFKIKIKDHLNRKMKKALLSNSQLKYYKTLVNKR